MNPIPRIARRCYICLWWVILFVYRISDIWIKLLLSMLPEHKAGDPLSRQHVKVCAPDNLVNQLLRPRREEHPPQIFVCRVKYRDLLRVRTCLIHIAAICKQEATDVSMPKTSCFKQGMLVLGRTSLAVSPYPSNSGPLWKSSQHPIHIAIKRRTKQLHISMWNCHSLWILLNMNIVII